MPGLYRGMGWTAPERHITTSAMTDATTAPALDLLIVGAGFAGLHMLFVARQRGFSARVLDAAPSVGGTWYHNRYPGARVDIPSLEYSYAFSEELQQEWRWSERYAAQPELLAYANHVADRFGLRSDIQLETRVERAAFDEARGLWQITTGRGEHFVARFLVMASGALSTPHVPAIPGFERYRGRLLHTGSWPSEALDFAGQRVAVFGTSSSAVQAVPLIAEQARALTVFQRTPCYAIPAHNGPLDRAYEQRVKADYAGFRAQNRRTPGGYGGDLPMNPQSALAVSPAQREAIFEQRWQVGGFAFMGAFNDLIVNAESNGYAAEFVRGKIRATVHDPETARRLSPTHPIGCKRLCIDSGYYQAFNRPQVELVDVRQEPVECITERGVRTSRRELPFDALVLATGFDALTGALTRIDLRGRGGLHIRDKWRDAAHNYLGLTIAGFPNLFHITGPGSTLAFTNAMVAIEQHVDWIADCVAHSKRAHWRTIEASEQAEQSWGERVQTAANRTLLVRCDSWFNGGNIDGKPRAFMPLAWSFARYSDHCTEVAQRGYEGFRLS